MPEYILREMDKIDSKIPTFLLNGLYFSMVGLTGSVGVYTGAMGEHGMRITRYRNANPS